LSQQEALNGREGALPANLRVRLVNGRRRLEQPEQEEDVRNRVVEAVVERCHFPGDLLSSSRFVVPGSNPEVTLQQLDQRQVGIALAVGDSEGLEKQAAVLRELLELMDEPRLPDTRISHDADDLS